MWFAREASLATALCCLVVVLQPDWVLPISRLLLVIVGVLATGAILARVLGQMPTEHGPGSTSGGPSLGEIRHIGEIEQANEFLLAVDYQLFPFLQGAIRDIAQQRLLAYHNVVLQREPVRARQILGEAVWEVVGSEHVGEHQSRWGTITQNELAVIADALEAI